MNKLTMPAILVATIMVAGAFAFMPVEQASTVHLSATAGQVKTASTISISAVTTISDTKAYPTMDVHNQVSAGYIIVNTVGSNVAIAGLANMDCAAWDAAGLELGVNAAAALGGEFADTNRNTYHCHIPDVAGTVLVGIAANGGTVAFAVGDIITTTIDTLT